MWTSDVGDYNATNSSNTIIKDTITDTTLVTPDTATVESLNSYNSDWNKWLLNTNNKSVTFFFSVSGGKSFTTKAQLILLPDLAPKNVADGWYTDPECRNNFTQTSVTEDTTLYGAPNVFIVTFDFGNGTSTSTECPYNETIDYPTELTREGYTFNGWEPEPEMMPARNFATKAQWTKVIEPTPSPSSSSSFVSKFVKIVFGEARLSEEDVKEIIKRYTNNDTTAYNIEIVARDDTSTTVIVRFNDTEAAVNFVEAIKSDSNSNWFLLTSISFLSENFNSLSPTTALPSFLLLLLLTTILASLIL